MESMKTHLGAKGVAELKTVLGVTDVAAVLSSRIENAVGAASVSSAPAATAAGGGVPPKT